MDERSTGIITLEFCLQWCWTFCSASIDCSEFKGRFGAELSWGDSAAEDVDGQEELGRTSLSVALRPCTVLRTTLTNLYYEQIQILRLTPLRGFPVRVDSAKKELKNERPEQSNFPNYKNL